MVKLVLGLAGRFGSGKSLVAQYLEKKGFFRITLSDLLREKAKARGEEPTRVILQNLGDEMREKFGTGVLAQLAWDKAVQLKSERVVIDGLRNPGEVEFLRKQFGFYLIKVEASEEIRFERLKKLNLPKLPKTWEEFIASEKRDLGVGQKESGQQVGEVLKMADFTVSNEGTESELYRQIRTLVRQLKVRS